MRLAAGQKGIGQQLITRQARQKQTFGKGIDRIRVTADQGTGLARDNPHL